MHALTMDAIKLFHEGTIALADAEAYGMKIDIDYCHLAKRKLEKKIKVQRMWVEKSELGIAWKKAHYHMNLGSNDQLKKLLYNTMALPCLAERIKEDNMTTDADMLSEITGKVEGIQSLLNMRKLEKALGTYLLPFIRESAYDGILHPFYHLHTVKTYRSSSSSINFQNIPVRDPVVGKIVRSAVIPRKDCYIAEIDYSGAEVRVSASLHKDKTMMKYIIDGSDMHRGVTLLAYCLSEEQMSNPKNKIEKKRIKDIRTSGKGDFTFPAFYGSFYAQIAKGLWDSIKHTGMVTKDGMCMFAHLASKGLTSYSLFENHIKEVEDWFWNTQYVGYTAWKNKRIREYERDGYFDLVSGFRCAGFMARNDILNYPIQGPAFHCLLWSFTQINNHIRKYKLKSRLIGQVHDSVIVNLHMSERDSLLQVIKQVMTVDVAKHYKWICAPMGIEAEITGLEQPWYTKEEIDV